MPLIIALNIVSAALVFGVVVGVLARSVLADHRERHAIVPAVAPRPQATTPERRTAQSRAREAYATS